MGKVIVTLDRTVQGYTAYMNEIPGCFTVGDDLAQIKVNLMEVIHLYRVGKLEDGEIIEEFLSEPLEFDFRMDVSDFFRLHNPIKQSLIAKKAGINPSLIRQYARGIKQPGIKQAKKIESAIHQLGRELLQVRF